MNVDLDVAGSWADTHFRRDGKLLLSQEAVPTGQWEFPKLSPPKVTLGKQYCMQNTKRTLRKNERAKSLNRVPPNAEEQGILHDYLPYKT